MGEKLGTREPALWELVLAACHVLAAELSKCQHLLGGSFGMKVRMNIAATGLNELVSVILLDPVVDPNDAPSHGRVSPAS